MLNSLTQVNSVSRSIDSKLSIALQNMVDAAGETAFEVKVRIRQRSQVLGKEGNFLMGREILAMMLDHFRATSKDEVLFNASHIHKTYSIVVDERDG